MAEKKSLTYVLALAFFLLVYLLGYEIERHETLSLLFLYSILFAGYTLVITGSLPTQLQFWIACAIGLRLVLLFSVPNLSEDVYRFIWDGRLLISGYHPFANVPSYYIENGVTVPGIDVTLYSKLNSKNYFTVYPSVAQFLFAFAAEISSSIYGAILVLKIIVFTAEVGSIFLLKKLLNHFNINPSNILIYALNPLVILELAGNVHLEALMIFFILLTLYFLALDRINFAALCLAISICVKIVPVIFLGAIFPLLGIKKTILFYLLIACFCLILFLPLLDMQVLYGFQNSLGYYFSRFEFNASIYYVARGLGYLLFGFNIIEIAGGVLGALAVLLMLMISFEWPERYKRFYKHFFTPSPHSQQAVWKFLLTIMWVLLIYFLFTTTLHPWYISTLLALSIFTPYKFVVIWTFTIFLTYSGYTINGFDENLWLTTFEYVAVLGYLAYEILWKRKSSLQPA